MKTAKELVESDPALALREMVKYKIRYEALLSALNEHVMKNGTVECEDASLRVTEKKYLSFTIKDLRESCKELGLTVAEDQEIELFTLKNALKVLGKQAIQAIGDLKEKGKCKIGVTKFVKLSLR